MVRSEADRLWQGKIDELPAGEKGGKYGHRSLPLRCRSQQEPATVPKTGAALKRGDRSPVAERQYIANLVR